MDRASHKSEGDRIVWRQTDLVLRLRLQFPENGVLVGEILRRHGRECRKLSGGGIERGVRFDSTPREGENSGERETDRKSRRNDFYDLSIRLTSGSRRLCLALSPFDGSTEFPALTIVPSQAAAPG